MRSLTLVCVLVVLFAPSWVRADGVYGPDNSPLERRTAIANLTDAGDRLSGVRWFLVRSESLLDGAAHALGLRDVRRCEGDPRSAADVLLRDRELASDVLASRRDLLDEDGVGWSVVCIDQFVAPGMLFKLFASRALRADSHRRSSVEPAIRSAVALDPLARWPAGEWERLEDQFLAIRARMLSEPDIPGYVAAEGLDVRIDGRPAVHGTWSLKPGNHLVQVSDGERLESRWVTISGPFVIGTKGELWEAAHRGLAAVRPGEISEPDPLPDAVRVNLPTPGERMVLVRGVRTFTIEALTGQVRGNTGRNGRGRWRARPSVAVAAGWWGFAVNCAPDIAPAVDRQRTELALVQGPIVWCAESANLLYPLASDHWATIEVSTALRIHVLALHFAVALGVAPGTNKPFDSIPGVWGQTRLRGGVGVESPRGPIRLGVRAEATVVPTISQVVVGRDSDNPSEITWRFQDVVFLGGGLAGTVSFQVARSPLWFRVEGATGIAGVWHGSVQLAMEFRTP